MNLKFLTNDPLNTSVSDSANGNVLYSIKTPYRFVAKRTTTIADAQGETIAVFQRRWGIGANRITFAGETKPASQWLENKGVTR